MGPLLTLKCAKGKQLTWFSWIRCHGNVWVCDQPHIKVICESIATWQIKWLHSVSIFNDCGITVMISMFPQTKDESNLPSSADQPCPMHPKQPFERKSSSSLQHCLRLLGRWTLSLGTLLSSPLAVWTSSTRSWDGRSMGEEHLQTRSIWIQLKIVRIQRQKQRLLTAPFPWNPVFEVLDDIPSLTRLDKETEKISRPIENHLFFVSSSWIQRPEST